MERSGEVSSQITVPRRSPSSFLAPRQLLARVGSLFPRNQVSEAVATTMHFDASPEAVWQGILFYEEVPKRPLLLLRTFMPRPVRTEGDKTRVGAIIRCTYDGGHLIKRITGAEQARCVEFDVLEQQLGIESCVSMGRGSYQIRGDANGSEVMLTTHYRGHLRPRWLWRPLERYLAHQVHRHILEGMRQLMLASTPALPPRPEPVALVHAAAPAE